MPERAAAIVALETQMARVHATRLESLAVTRANNPWPVAEFPARAPGLDWAAFLDAAHLGSVPRIIAWHPGAIAALAALVASEPLETWRDWLLFHAVDRRSDLLAARLRRRAVRVPRSHAGRHPLAERAVEAGRLVHLERNARRSGGRSTSASTFRRKPRPARRRSCRRSWRRSGNGSSGSTGCRPPRKRRPAKSSRRCTWASATPTGGRDYTALEVRRGDALGNAERASRFEYLRNIAKLDAPVDRDRVVDDAADGERGQPARSRTP